MWQPQKKIIAQLLVKTLPQIQIQIQIQTEMKQAGVTTAEEDNCSITGQNTSTITNSCWQVYVPDVTNCTHIMISLSKKRSMYHGAFFLIDLSPHQNKGFAKVVGSWEVLDRKSDYLCGKQQRREDYTCNVCLHHAFILAESQTSKLCPNDLKG